jgi:chorismate mutase / prephenate dehydrogenase
MMLDEYRKKIQDIDGQIAELIAHRLELAKQVGRAKEAEGLPVRDYGVEKTVLERMAASARSLNVDESVLREIGLALIKGAVNVQYTGRTQKMDIGDQTCAIIGGKGQMGRWFARFSSSLGYKTIVVDREDSLIDCLTVSDLIIVAVSLEAMPEVLAEVVAAQPKGVVLEIASLKSSIYDLAIDGIAQGVRLASIHPMFGPDKDLLAGQNVIICDAGCPDAEETACKLFSETAANLITLPLREHDRYMTWVLNLPHLINLIMGESLRHSGFSFHQLSAVGGTTFNKQMEVTTEVMAENAKLYHQIQHLNRHRPDLYQTLLASIEKLQAASDAPDSGEFADLMKAWESYARD